MKYILAFVLAISFLAMVQSSEVIAPQQNPDQQGQGVPIWSSRRPAEPAPIDISPEVQLTIVSTKEQYEQLEPIKLRVELKNLSKDEITYKDVSECRLLSYEIIDITRNVAVVDTTRYGKFNYNGPGRGSVLLKPDGTRRTSVYPNLCIDMTAPAVYSITASMDVKRSADDRRCITRSKPIRVEVTPLFNGR
jgi:hypothetical protein